VILKCFFLIQKYIKIILKNINSEITLKNIKPQVIQGSFPCKTLKENNLLRIIVWTRDFFQIQTIHEGFNLNSSKIPYIKIIKIKTLDLRPFNSKLRACLAI